MDSSTAVADIPLSMHNICTYCSATMFIFVKIIWKGSAWTTETFLHLQSIVECSIGRRVEGVASLVSSRTSCHRLASCYLSTAKIRPNSSRVLEFPQPSF